MARLQQSLEDEIKETGFLLRGSAVRAKGLHLSPLAYAHEILQADVPEVEFFMQQDVFDDLQNSQNPVGGKEDQSGLSHDSL